MFNLCIITHVLVCPVGVALAPRMLQIFFLPSNYTFIFFGDRIMELRGKHFLCRHSLLFHSFTRSVCDYSMDILR